jgi:Sedlin, N-terminal conserved region
MAAVALAVIGKNNEPLYIKTFLRDDIDDDPPEEELFGLPITTTTTTTTSTTTTTTKAQRSLRQQFILHAALDRFEKISGPYPGCAWREHHPGIAGNDAMFVGLLCPVEDLRVYGTEIQMMILLLLLDANDSIVMY